MGQTCHPESVDQIDYWGSWTIKKPRSWWGPESFHKCEMNMSKSLRALGVSINFWSRPRGCASDEAGDWGLMHQNAFLGKNTRWIDLKVQTIRTNVPK